MQKIISYTQFQSVKAIAKACEGPFKKRESILKKIKALEEECKAYDLQIEATEAGILKMTGFHVSDLVKRVVEPTGKIDQKTGKALTSVKYLPTDIVSYDTVKKQYIVNVSDAEDTNFVEEGPVPPTTADGLGSDYDLDKETIQMEAPHSEDVEDVEDDMESIFD